MGLGIKMFEIKGLFNRFDVKLPLDNDVNIFLGENGLGKTTILNCFYYALKCDFEKLNNIIFKKIIFTFIDGDSIQLDFDEIQIYNQICNNLKQRFGIFDRGDFSLIEKIFSKNELEKINSRDLAMDELEKYRIKIREHLKVSSVRAMRILNAYIEFNHIVQKKNDRNENVINFKNKISERITNNIIYCPTYRRIEEEMSNLGIDLENKEIDTDLIRFGMEDVQKNIENLLNTIKSEAISTFRKMTGLLIRQYLNGLNLNNLDSSENNLDSFEIDINKLEIVLARIGDGIDPDDKEEIKKIVGNGSIYNKNNVYLLNLIKNLINSYDKQRIYDERIKEFMNVCNKYLRGKKFVYNESTVELDIFTDDGEKIEMKNLSSGEKQIVSIFSKLYIQDISNCAVIFDEPELSLSIIWQENFLPDIMNSKKCRFILAVTHSPFIFSNEFNEIANDMSEFISIHNK